MNTRDNGVLCDAGQSVLVVVDVQPRLTAAMPAKVLARLQRSTSLLLRVAARLEIPVMVTEQYPAGLGNLESELARLLPEGTRTYEKTAFSCTGSAGFTADLAGLSRRHVILTGMETHVCILQTALDIMAMGYHAVIVNDAVCSRNRDNYENALGRLFQAGAVITNSESLIFEWLRDARHEHFRTIQSWLK